MSKTCPHCRQSLNDTTFKCTRCEQWVANELFDRLSGEDVALIKNRDLTPFTPSLMAVMVICLMTDGIKQDRIQWQKILGRQPTRPEEFKLRVFDSYCHFSAIRLSAGKKQGHGSSIVEDLKAALLNAVLDSTDVKMSGTDYEQSRDVFKIIGEGVYRQLDRIWKDLGTDTTSQFRDAKALASAVLGDEQVNMLRGMALYARFMEMIWHLRGEFSKVFLVEENDFDWQATTDGRRR